MNFYGAHGCLTDLSSCVLTNNKNITCAKLTGVVQVFTGRLFKGRDLTKALTKALIQLVDQQLVL